MPGLLRTEAVLGLRRGGTAALGLAGLHLAVARGVPGLRRSGTAAQGLVGLRRYAAVLRLRSGTAALGLVAVDQGTAARGLRRTAALRTAVLRWVVRTGTAATREQSTAAYCCPLAHLGFHSPAFGTVT